ncbi:polyprenyl synthetase family protein [bacterium]|nr:polyprenyl synthetase family protein [bacterium]
MNFNDKYSQIKIVVDKELSIVENKMVVSVREPLNSQLIKFLSSPSKRIRSVLPLLFIKACNQTPSDTQLEVLSAVELVHNASLIHDDIIDESEFRRGEKTISAKFGTKLGVITGDYLLSQAMEKIVKIGSLEIFSHFTSTLKYMCIGEINQNFDKFKIGTIEEYIEKSKNKTARLFETAFACCEVLNENPQKYCNAAEFGLNTGIAFQIRDDLLNVIRFGASNDIKQGIYNSAVIYSGSVENYSFGIEKTRDLLNNYIENAKSQAAKLPDNDYKYKIFEFLELLKND